MQNGLCRETILDVLDIDMAQRCSLGDGLCRVSTLSSISIGKDETESIENPERR